MVMLGDVTEPLPKVALAARRPGSREALCAAPRHTVTALAAAIVHLRVRQRPFTLKCFVKKSTWRFSACVPAVLVSRIIMMTAPAV